MFFLLSVPFHEFDVSVMFAAGLLDSSSGNLFAQCVPWLDMALAVANLLGMTGV